MFQIAVIGGTGLIGSKVVDELRKRGHEAIAAAPSTGVDTITGMGLDDLLASTEIVVDVSNSPSFDDQPAMDFFTTGGRKIAEAEVRAGVRHHVALSVVGIEQMQASGYFRAKLAQERLIAEAGVPYTIVRATQFFEFLRAIANFSTVDGAVRLPPVGFRPMAAQDIALAVAEAALGNPRNGVVEIGGPEMFTLDQPVRQVLGRDGDPREVVADPAAPYFGIEVDQTTLVPRSAAHLGATTLEWWIDHVPPPPAR
ncbi:MAG TPA: SDR family oxidoreductase [Croceibacterium sp.]|nr:SDR family oxidoreductase [Croceibacterium sp.]